MTIPTNLTRVLFYDTETSDFAGRPNAHLVQFAGRVMNYSDPSNPYVITELSTLVKHPVTSSPGAFATHGVTRDMAEHGLTVRSIVQWFINQTALADLVVAHNITFDDRMMKQEINRIKRPHQPYNSFCTMTATKDLCKIPPTAKQLARGFTAFKQPKLEEALSILLDHTLVGAHDALADTRGCELLFRHLLNLSTSPPLDPQAARFGQTT